MLVLPVGIARPEDVEEAHSSEQSATVVLKDLPGSNCQATASCQTAKYAGTVSITLRFTGCDEVDCDCLQLTLLGGRGGVVNTVRDPPC